jgi:hypothetical protein
MAFPSRRGAATAFVTALETAVRLAGLIVVLMFAAACAASPERDSPFYQSGFADGCASASGEAAPIKQSPQRDEALYAKESGYRSGWISGHAACRMQSGPPRL